MVIETKFNVRDEAWYINQGAIKVAEIYRIKAEYIDMGGGKYAVQITYTLGSHDMREPELHSTKEEAGIAWLKKQGLDCGLKG